MGIKEKLTEMLPNKKTVEVQPLANIAGPSKTILELPVTTEVTGDDYVIIEKDGKGTHKVSALILADSTVIIDNLTTSDSSLALSARMGMVLSDKISALASVVGDTRLLETVAKGDLVSAINELNDLLGEGGLTPEQEAVIAKIPGLEIIVGTIGDVAALNTNAKDDLVSAINELHAREALTSAEKANIAKVPGLEAKIGDIEQLTTTQKANLVGAINEIATSVSEMVGLTPEQVIDLGLISTINNKVTVNSNNIADIDTDMGDLTQLKTLIKSSLVEAINEMQDKITINQANIDKIPGMSSGIDGINSAIGDLSTLETADKVSLVKAINELVVEVSSNALLIGDVTTLNTTAKDDLVSAINELHAREALTAAEKANIAKIPGLEGRMDVIENQPVLDADDMANINKVPGLESKMGDLSSLNTTAKDTLVKAINELKRNLAAIEGLTPEQIANILKIPGLEQSVNNNAKSIRTNTLSMGVLAELETNMKDNLVKAINEIVKVQTTNKPTIDKVDTIESAVQSLSTVVGSLSGLTTPVKTSIVASINDVYSALTTLSTQINTKVGELSNLATTDKASIVAAINELKTEQDGLVGMTEEEKVNIGKVPTIETEIGDITTLNTTAKSNLVASINELEARPLAGTTEAEKAILGKVDPILARVDVVEPKVTSLETNMGTAKSDIGTLKTGVAKVTTEVGDLSGLDTTVKTDVISAINEIKAQSSGLDPAEKAKLETVGTVGELTTTAKNTTVAAINELDGQLGTVGELTTTAKNTAVAAINELDAEVGNIGSLKTTAKGTVVASINEIHDEVDVNKAIVGDLSGLDTTVKTDVISAINEVKAQTSGLDPAEKAKLSTIGTIGELTTTAKNTAVAAINELDAEILTNSNDIDTLETQIGTIGSLKTTAKDTVVGAINEIHDEVDANKAIVGDLSGLDTTVKTDVIAAINEVKAQTSGLDPAEKAKLETVGSVGGLTTTAKDTVVAAINELVVSDDSIKALIGLLSSLNTTDKSSTVAAINEVKASLPDMDNNRVPIYANDISAVKATKDVSMYYGTDAQGIVGVHKLTGQGAGGGAGVSSIIQVVSTNVTANTPVKVDFPKSVPESDIIVQCMEFIPGAENVVSILSDFEAIESENFEFNPDEVEFTGGKVKLKLHPVAGTPVENPDVPGEWIIPITKYDNYVIVEQPTARDEK